MQKTILISLSLLAALAIGGCATDLSNNPYMDQSCEMLAPQVEIWERTSLMDRADLFNDAARQHESRESGSPYSDRVQRRSADDNGTAQDREDLQTAYKVKGCNR